MLSEVALIAIASLSSQSTAEGGISIGADEELQTSVRLFESDNAVRFEFTGPNSVAQTIAIDINRNGAVDRNVDFQISSQAGDSPCLQLLLDDRSSSVCKPVGAKAKVERRVGPQSTVTEFVFLKAEVSGDGFGFGFSVKLCSTTGQFCTALAGGDYRFGGKLSLVNDGPSFKGDEKPDIPQPMLAALRRYQGCVNKGISALAPLDRSSAAEVRALPTTCADDRAKALDEGIKALVESGTKREEATEMMRNSLDGYDEQIGHMADTLETAS